MSRLSVSLPGLHLKNPVIPASGTCWYGQEIARNYDLNKLGSLVIKSTTSQPRKGNPAPRACETSAGWLNAYGLNNAGVDNVVQEKLPWLAQNYPELPVIASAAGVSEEEYEAVAAKLGTSPYVSAMELNVSCPNVKHGGLAMGTDPELLERLTRRCVAGSNLPLNVKLPPRHANRSEDAQAKTGQRHGRAFRGGLKANCTAHDSPGSPILQHSDYWRWWDRDSRRRFGIYDGWCQCG